MPYNNIADLTIASCVIEAERWFLVMGVVTWVLPNSAQSFPVQYQAKPPQLCSSIVGVMLAAAWLRVLVRGGLCPDQGGGGLFNVNEHPARARTVGLIKRLAVLI